MMEVVTVRSADPADLPRIAAIYDEQVRTAISTFDLDSPGLGYWEARLASNEPGDHVLVADSSSGDVVGYASEALHLACGFARVGLLPDVGWKFDRWIDTALWGLTLS